MVEGELIHSDITAKLSTSTTSKIFPVDEIVATRKTGDFFRVAGLSSKESRVGGYARLMTVRKTTLLLLTPAALFQGLAEVLANDIGCRRLPRARASRKTPCALLDSTSTRTASSPQMIDRR